MENRTDKPGPDLLRDIFLGEEICFKWNQVQLSYT